MLSKKLWSRTMDQCYKNAWEEYQAGPEWIYHNALEEKIDQERKNEFTEDQNQLIEEWLDIFRKGRDAESRALYQAGFRDCISLFWMLFSPTGDS